MKQKHHFKADELNALHAALQKAEANTSGEIVPMVVNQSASYNGLHAFCGFIGLLFGTALAVYWQKHYPWGSNLIFVSWQFIGLALFFTLSELPFVMRLLLPHFVVAHEVRRAAFANFLAIGLAHKKEQNGILLYISLCERKVEVVADAGIHKKMGEEYWQRIADKLSQSIAQHTLALALQKAIAELGEMLTKEFPRTDAEGNLFSDNVQEDTLA